MLNKTLIALSAAAVIGSVSAAFAYEAPEHKIGDRYPFLEQTYKPTTATRFVGGTVMPRPVVQYGYQAPEHMLGDRYQAFATVYQPIAAGKISGRKVAIRNYGAYSAEAPENKIGDRYPSLEHVYAAQTRSTGRVMAVRVSKHSMKKV
jgi:hypothetical protein